MSGPIEGGSRWSFGGVRRYVAMAFAALVILAIGVLIGKWAADNDVRLKLMGFIENLTRDKENTGPQTAEWHRVDSSLHDLEVATIRLTPFETHARGGAIAEIADGIVFFSPTGRVGYLNAALEMQNVATRVPLDWAGLEQSAFPNTPGFMLHQFRVLDILAVDRGEATTIFTQAIISMRKNVSKS